MKRDETRSASAHRDFGVLLPRRRKASDFHRQDAAVCRAVDRALGAVGGRTCVGDPFAGRDTTKRGDVTLHDYASMLDGLVLHGGSDVWPGSYGEEPIKPEWSGDRVRDEYEIALLRAFIDAGKPVLGVCRGLQVINVAFGGTLYQDIAMQQPGSRTHRDAALYDQNFHEIEFVAGHASGRALSGRRRAARVNSVHHQAVKKLADGFTVEATSPDDGMVEAMRWTGALVCRRRAMAPRVSRLEKHETLVGRPHPE